MFGRKQREAWKRAGRQVNQARKRNSYAGGMHVASVSRTLVRAKTEVLKFDEMQAAGQVVAEGDGEGVPYWLQADPSLNSSAMVLRRFGLRNHALVVAALDAWWSAVMHSLSDCDAPRVGAFGDRAIARSGYDYTYMKIFRCMLRELDPAEIMESLDEDWLEDSQGDGLVTREEFMDAIFQLADVTCCRDSNPRSGARATSSPTKMRPCDCDCLSRCGQTA